MTSNPSPPTLRANLDSIFNAALHTYKKKTGKDITTHPLATELQSCHSPDTVLAVLRRQIPSLNQPQSGEERFAECLTPVINVLYAFTATFGDGVGMVFSPANAIFTGIGVLLLAAKDVNARQDTLMELFSRIEYFFRRLEIYTEIPPTTVMTGIAVDIVVEVFTILGIATKEMKRGLMKRYLKKLMGNTDVEESLRRLDNLTQEEVKIASAEQLKIAHTVEGKVMDVDERVKEVRGDVQSVSKKVQDVGQSLHGKLDDTNRNLLRDNLLRWLSPSDPSANHNIASKAHHDGTALWFFQGGIFNEWKSAGSFLWVHGKPGSGKTVLCSSVIQDIMTLHDSGRASMAYFYFDFKDVDKQKLQNLLPSLLIQLSARSDARCDILSQLYSSHDRGVQKPNDRNMMKCLQEMLALDAQGPTYIIVDAIDECPLTSSVPSPREEVLELIEELVGLHLPDVHICVTSRPELDIQAILEPLTPHPVSLHDETGQKQDIADYVRSFVHGDRRMRRWRDEDKDLVIKTLSEKADGMFRWVYCQLEVLRHCFPPSVCRILEELPESLDETYERILRAIQKSNQEHAYRMLQCLVAAVRPLRVEELAEVLAFDFNAEGIPKLNPAWRWEEQEEAVMSTCSSLVIVVKGDSEDSRIVQFAHFSVKEYLMSSRLAESSREVSRFHILPEPAHIILAQACLGVLLQLDDHITRENIKNFPLANYAARLWVTHGRVENVSSHIIDGMKFLFDTDKPHFAAWLWARSMSTAFPEKPDTVPLYYAALFGFRDLAEHLLIEHPEDVDAKGGYEVTPLHASVMNGHFDVSLLLTEHLRDPDVRGRHLQTPLHRVLMSNLVRKGDLEIGQRLLDCGADVNAQDSENWTPLYLAAWNGRLDFAQMLLKHGAAINVPTDDGETPLHKASENGHVDVVRLLLEHGADPNMSDKREVPSDVVSRREIVQLLSDYMTKPTRV